MASEETSQVRDVGAPVRGVNWVTLIVGKAADGAEALYATMGQQADNLFILQINPQDGSFTQHKATGPGSNYPTASAWGKDDRLYVGAANSGRLLRYDPRAGAMEDLGPIDPPGGTFPCRIAVGSDGRLWIGCYGNAGLTSYDPASGEFVRYGRMDEVDMYCYPSVGSDGTVACRIGVTKPHVVAFNPVTGEKRSVGPVVTAGEPGQSVSLQTGSDGMLYVVSSQGNFRLRGMNAEPVDQAPPAQPAATLSDGSTFSFADAAQQEYRTLAITNPKTGEKRQWHLDYDAAGSGIFLVHLGPDGKVYGTTWMPEHLFRADPATGELADLGQCSLAAGEAYSMGNLDGKLYIASYPGARLSVYDPKQPYHFGEGQDDNPRDVGRMDNVSYRPRAMLAGPLGRVWIGSYPDYGMWGGPLTCYDPATGEKHSYGSLLENQSVVSLAWLDNLGLIVAGTSTFGGSGTLPKATEAALVLWNPLDGKIVWQAPPKAGTTSITSLATGANGMLYGIALGQEPKGSGFADLFAFEAATHTFAYSLPVPGGNPLENSLQLGPDGAIWGLTADALYRLDPATRQIQVIAKLPGEFNIPGPIVGNTLYFATGHRLRALTIEALP